MDSNGGGGGMGEGVASSGSLLQQQREQQAQQQHSQASSQQFHQGSGIPPSSQYSALELASLAVSRFLSDLEQLAFRDPVVVLSLSLSLLCLAIFVAWSRYRHVLAEIYIPQIVNEEDTASPGKAGPFKAWGGFYFKEPPKLSLAEKRKAEATHRARFLTPAEERALELQRAAEGAGGGGRDGGREQGLRGVADKHQQLQQQQQERAKVD